MRRTWFLGAVLTAFTLVFSLAVNVGIVFLSYGLLMAGGMGIVTLVLDLTRVGLAALMPRAPAKVACLYLVAALLGIGFFELAFQYAIDKQSAPDQSIALLRATQSTLRSQVVEDVRPPEKVVFAQYCVNYPDHKDCDGVRYRPDAKKQRLEELGKELETARNNVRLRVELAEIAQRLTEATGRSDQERTNRYRLSVPNFLGAQWALPVLVSIAVELGIIVGAWLMRTTERTRIGTVSTRSGTERPVPPSGRPNTAPGRSVPIRVRSHSRFRDWLFEQWTNKKATDGVAWFTQREMAQGARISKGAVNAFLRSLEAEGQIELWIVAGPGPGTGVKWRVALRTVA